MAGFTLIEMLVVVVIIGLFAAMAAPGIARRLDAYALRADAEAVANLYRNARLRAMGRGSAVMVRFKDSGVLEVREAIWGPGAGYSDGCDTLPQPSCTLSPATLWKDGGAQNQLLQTLDSTNSGSHTVKLEDPSANAQDPYEVCFSPMGRAYSRETEADVFAVLSGVPRITLDRTDQVGLGLHVLVLPNGATRVTAVAP